jgi:hypothetical protein
MRVLGQRGAAKLPREQFHLANSVLLFALRLRFLGEMVARLLAAVLLFERLRHKGDIIGRCSRHCGYSVEFLRTRLAKRT